MEHVQVVETRLVSPNPENPRLIFHQDELNALQDSIEQRGILVPLTVFRDGKRFTILDGERRWRCAVKLGFEKVPAIIQPKPDKLTNLMMMFAIHHRRNEWDPLPTALKLRDLENLYASMHGAVPNEKQLAEIASLTRGEVRRYKKLLSLPNRYISMLMDETMKPRSQQKLTVDHVLEATAASTALVKRDLLAENDEDAFRWSVIEKFRSGVIESTVDPRLFSKLARAVDRGEVSMSSAKKAIRAFIKKATISAREVYYEVVGDADYVHTAEQSVTRLVAKLDGMLQEEISPSATLLSELRKLQKVVRKILEA